MGVALPLLWVWIGSKLQGGGADTVNSSTAAIIFAGIVLTYLALLFVAGWIVARGEPKEAEPRPPTRYPWNRSMRDEPYRPGEKRLTAIESAFVFTTVVVTAAFMLWFFVFAGSSLPDQSPRNSRRVAQAGECLIVEDEVGCCEVLLEVLDRGRAREQQDIRRERSEPRDGDRRGQRAEALRRGANRGVLEDALAGIERGAQREEGYEWCPARAAALHQRQRRSLAQIEGVVDTGDLGAGGCVLELIERDVAEADATDQALVPHGDHRVEPRVEGRVRLLILRWRSECLEDA